MKPFEILGHTAELKIKAYGKTKEELFANMLQGMMATFQPSVHEDAAPVKQSVSVESQDSETLLVDFLSEVLYLAQANKEVYDDVTFHSFSDTNLDADLTGRKADSFGDDIKAVTHHGVLITRAPKGLWEVEVIYDI